jgi:hypothetical protein
MEGVQFDHDRRRGDGVQTAETAQHADGDGVAGFPGKLLQLVRQERESTFEVFDTVEVVGEDDLVPHLLEAHSL